MAKIKLANLGAVGLIKDVADGDLPPEAFTDAVNVRFNREGAVAFGGHRLVFRPSDRTPTWIRPFPPITNPIWVYADAQGIWTWDGVEHLEITRESGPYGGGPQNRWQGEVFNGVGIFNNGIDVPQMWLGFSSANKLQDLSAWPAELTASWVRPFGFFLIAGHMYETGAERPFRVRWSHPAEPGSVPVSWALDDPTKDSGELDLAETPDYVVDGLALGEIFVVYKEKTAWAMQYVGGQQIFNTWQIISDRGLLWKDCVQAIPGGHFVVGQDDIYIHTGQRNSVQSIVQDKLRQWVFKQLSIDTFYNSFTLINRSESEVWFCFPEAGATYATLAAVWNWTTNSWGLRDLPEIPFASSGVVQEESELDTWGSPDVYANGGLVARSASLSAVVDLVAVAQPAALQAQAAVVRGSGEIGVPGWPAFDATYYATVYGNGGPLKLSEMALTTDSLLPYNQQTSKIVITVQPGLLISGAYGNQNQAALWLDQLYGQSQVILNLGDSQIVGVSGGAEENGFPAVLISGNSTPYIKTNNGTITGGAAGSSGAQGYAFVAPTGTTFLDIGLIETGGEQQYGGLSASLSDSGISAVVANGTVTLGHVDVTITGAANDRNPRIYISRLSGDSAIGALWDRSSLAEPTKVVFTSTGTNRRREATFEITVVDGAGRSIVAGLVDVEAVHGDASYILTIDPSSVNEVIQLPASNGASATWTGQFIATLQGGVGPFLYDWTTSVGTITAGQTTATITLEQYSGALPEGQDVVFQGNLTCTVTDVGAGSDQILKVVPVYLFFDNSLPQSDHIGSGAIVSAAATVAGEGEAIVFESIGDGALLGRPAVVAGVGAMTPLNPVVVTVTPDTVVQTAVGPGTGTYSYTLTLNLSAVTTGDGGALFRYSWSATGWTFVGDNHAANVVLRRTFSCALDQTVSYSGTITAYAQNMDYEDLGSDSTTVQVTVTNPVVKRLITGSGGMNCQPAAMTGSGFNNSPSVMNIQILPSIINVSAFGSTLSWSQLFTASRTGGVGPFTYQWSTTLGTFSGSTTSSTATLEFSMTAAPGAIRTRTGVLSVAVTDTGRPGTSAVQSTCSLNFELDNSDGGGGGEIP